MNTKQILSSLSLALAFALPAAAVAAPQAAPAPAPAQPSPPPAAAAGHRIELPGAEGKAFPYTIEIPDDWQQRQVKGIPGVWLGPHGAEPPNDPRLIYVRISQASLADPEGTAAAIRSNDASQADWVAPLVEVRDVGGVRGVLVQMDSGQAAQARSTLALKLPVGRGSVDFLFSAPRGEFEKLRPAMEKILLTVRPLPASPPGAAAGPG
jgi:hypothetical protein